MLYKEDMRSLIGGQMKQTYTLPRIKLWVSLKVPNYMCRIFIDVLMPKCNIFRINIGLMQLEITAILAVKLNQHILVVGWKAERHSKVSKRWVEVQRGVIIFCGALLRVLWSIVNTSKLTCEALKNRRIQLGCRSWYDDPFRHTMGHTTGGNSGGFSGGFGVPSLQSRFEDTVGDERQLWGQQIPRFNLYGKPFRRRNTTIDTSHWHWFTLFEVAELALSWTYNIFT